MIVFIASFIVFLLFVLGLSLGLVLKGKPLVSEDEAKSTLLDNGACVTCQQMCALAGKKQSKKKVQCKIKDTAIPHQKIQLKCL